MNQSKTTPLAKQSHMGFFSPDDSRPPLPGNSGSDHRQIGAKHASFKRKHRVLYLPVPAKFVLALLIALIWIGLSIWLSLPWLNDLGELFGTVLAALIVAFIAYAPGFMNAFLISSIMMDRRPMRIIPADYPGVTVLVACYNETENIADTIKSLSLQNYPGPLQVLIMDDGSTDDTVAVAHDAIRQHPWAANHEVRIVTAAANAGKAAALNRGLSLAKHGLIATVDGDSWLYRQALRRIVERYLSDPPGTRAVAGSIAVRNSRENWLTRTQEWDYFHGIAAVKRMQSMYHGTLVAQGAFSLYDRSALRELGGWPECVGEDIVVSWSLLEAGHRIGFCEDAVLFTNTPTRLKQFARQRQRWSRGLIEAFVRHWKLLFKGRMSTLFIWWNLLFLPMDLTYTLVFIPGIVAALFGHYAIAGLMTLLVLPLAMCWNLMIYSVQRRMFRRQHLSVRRNIGGFLLFSLAYSLLLQPVCVWGYAAELLGARKHWGTK